MKNHLKRVLDTEMEYSNGKNAAVLVPIFYSTEPEILMIKRSEKLSRNAGEIAFPGGLEEKGETPIETAIRETKEELDIDKDSIKIMGFLKPETVKRYDIKVYPVVGLIIAEKKFTPNFEVSKILIDKLDNVFSTRKDGKGGITYRIHGYTIWGASSMIINDLYMRLTNIKI